MLNIETNNTDVMNDFAEDLEAKHLVEISVIIPVYNEEAVIASIVERVNAVLVQLEQSYEIIVIDDGSDDATAVEAETTGATVLQHPYNIGNGAAIKNGIREANGDILVLMDGDGQHNAEDIPRLLEPTNIYDMVVGARVSDSETSLHRTWANKMYNTLATYVVGYRVEDLTSGFRAIDAVIAKKFVHLFPNGFSYPSTSTIALFRSGYSVKYVPIKVSARVGKSKINLLRDGVGFILTLARIGTLFAPMRIFIPIALIVFLPGFFYAIYKLIYGKSWTLPIVISITVGLLIFVLGLISEQIALLRMERTE